LLSLLMYYIRSAVLARYMQFLLHTSRDLGGV
jgi:hypothetical protein